MRFKFKNLILLAAIVSSVPAFAEAPVIWNGTLAKWLPSGIRGPAFLQVDSLGVMSPSTSSGSGTVTSILTGAGLTGGPITTSGTISLVPASTTLGGLQSSTAAGSLFLTGLANTGILTSRQPAFTDISGRATGAQLPPSGASLGGVQSSVASGTAFLSGLATTGIFTSRSISGSDLPPSGSSLGGVQGSVASGNLFLTGLANTGIFTSAQPSFGNISGSVASIQLPPPGATALGGVDSQIAVSHKWLRAITTTGGVQTSQPDFTDITGVVTGAQLPPSGASLGGVQSSVASGSLFFNGLATTGIFTSAQPLFSNLGGSLGLGQMPATNASVGTFTNATVTANAQGLITAIATGSSSGTILPGYLSGASLAFSTTTAFNVAAGTVTDSTSAVYMTVAALTKTTSAWSLGNNGGCLDTGAIAASKWYNVFIVERTDLSAIDVLCSLSPLTPTMPANYTYKRRIGSLLTNGSSQWTNFAQWNDEFRWAAVVADVATTNPGTAAVTVTMSTPLGVIVEGIFNTRAYNGSSTDDGRTDFFSPLIDDGTSGSNSLFNAGVGATAVAGGQVSGQIRIPTNTLSQIKYIQPGAVASSVINIGTVGWIDARGQR